MDDKEFKDIQNALDEMNLRRVRQDLRRHGVTRIYTKEGAQILAHTFKDAREELAARKNPNPRWETFTIRKKD